MGFFSRHTLYPLPAYRQAGDSRFTFEHLRYAFCLPAVGMALCSMLYEDGAG
jgi:hypothetical protein